MTLVGSVLQRGYGSFFRRGRRGRSLLVIGCIALLGRIALPGKTLSLAQYAGAQEGVVRPGSLAVTSAPATPAAQNGNETSNATWRALLGGAAAGVLAIIVREVLGYALTSSRRRSERKVRVRDVVDQHLDPILKAADELVGKLRSLAQEDFRDYWHLKKENASGAKITVELGNVIYLFAHFWARLEILRREGLYINLNKDKRGRRLMEFLNCLESTHVRVLERAYQRAIGESLVEEAEQTRECLSFYAFMKRYGASAEFRNWHEPLRTAIHQTENSRGRQRLLLYGVVVHALIDTLDPKHATTKERPGYANKLTDKTRRQLRFRVFGKYLPFVKNVRRFLAHSEARKKTRRATP